jgi:hypothetical protein
MKSLNLALAAGLATLSTITAAHEGHGTPGTISHDLQHQLWTFAAVVAVGALLFAGDRVVALLRVAVKPKRDRDGASREDDDSPV